MLVRTENKIPAAELPEKSPEQALAGQEIYWMRKSGDSWSTPAPVTGDALVDAEPSVGFTPDGASGLLAYSHGITNRVDNSWD